MVINSVSHLDGVYMTLSAKPVTRASRSEENRDYCTLSSQAKDYQMVKNVLKNIPDIREEKAKDISQKIEKGECNIDASAIADKLLKLKS